MRTKIRKLSETADGRLIVSSGKYATVYQEQNRTRSFKQQQQLVTTGTFQYFAVKLLNYWWNAGAYTWPTTFYLGQDTGTPTATAPQYEVSSANGYTRLSITVNTTNWGTIAATNVMTSTATQTMATASGVWTGNSGTNTTCRYGVFNDTSGTSGGNWIAWGANGTAETVVNLDAIQYPSGNITITLN